MLEYRRQLELAQEQCLALTSELDRIQSAEAALRACWQSLSPSIALEAFPSFSHYESAQDYASALEQLAEYHTAQLRAEEIQDEGSDVIQKLTAESVANKQALALTQAQLHSLKAQLDQMQDKWARAEKRADRSLSSTVAILEKRNLAHQQPPPDSPSVEQQPSPSALASSAPQSNKSQPMAIEPAQSQQEHERQRKEISSLYEAEEQLRLLAAQRQTEIDQLRLALQYPTDEAVRKSPAYAALRSELDSARTDVDSTLRQLEALQTEIDTLREVQVSWRDALLKDHAVSQELEKRHQDRERDLARIRLQREELKAENTELKQREAEKYKSVDQVKELANSKEVRVELDNHNGPANECLICHLSARTASRRSKVRCEDCEWL